MQPAANVPDLSGLWGPGLRGGLRWDVTGELPMTPWAAEKFKAARPPFGPNATFEGINDPVQLYCDPPGIPRIYNYPWQLTLLQTPKVVYILYEFTRTWRSVAMDRDHPKDPDSTWLGDSVGRYEGDTLVIDTVGFNDKTWLDHPGHPHTDALHIIERFRRLDHDTLEILFTVDDPSAYTKPFTGRRLLALSASPMGETLCSMSENDSFKKQIMDPTVGSGPK
ncbi:MAG TPA: hypothetical protein VN976_00435 [Verrucomicrobiae bacterium]|nr:hypothetical protein [Verrucomicrobiae bacterium]